MRDVHLSPTHNFIEPDGKFLDELREAYPNAYSTLCKYTVCSKCGLIILDNNGISECNAFNYDTYNCILNNKLTCNEILLLKII
jgi:hypothetical protein